MSEPCTGYVFDFATPTPSRAQNSWNAFVTAPHMARNAANARFAHPITGGRR